MNDYENLTTELMNGVFTIKRGSRLSWENDSQNFVEVRYPLLILS